jgi:hypothetical protein
MASYVPPKKNTEYIFYVCLISQANTKLFQNNPTIAAGDFLVSTDGGATSNLDTLPAVTPAASDIVKITVSATEMNGDNVIIVASDQAGSEWCDQAWHIHPAGQLQDEIYSRIGAPAGASIAADLLTIDNLVDDLESRLTAARAGYLDALNGHTAQTGDSFARLGAPAGASIAADLLAIDNFVDDLETRLTAARAGYLDNLNGHTAQTGDSFARLGLPAGASIAADIAALNDLSAAQVAAQVAAELATYDGPTNAEMVARTLAAAAYFDPATDKVIVTSIDTDAIDAAALNADAAAEIADKILGRSIQGGADGGRTVTSALRRIRNKVSLAGGTMTVTEEDDATSAWTAAYTTAAGDPITSIDPT